MQKENNTFQMFQAALVAKFGEGSTVNTDQMLEVIADATKHYVKPVKCIPALYRCNAQYKIGKDTYRVSADAPKLDTMIHRGTKNQEVPFAPTEQEVKDKIAELQASGELPAEQPEPVVETPVEETTDMGKKLAALEATLVEVGSKKKNRGKKAA
jgi:hypothetical protein